MHLVKIGMHVVFLVLFLHLYSVLFPVSGSSNSLQQVKVMSLIQGSPAGREQQEMAQKQGYGIGLCQSREQDIKLPPLSVWSFLQENKSLNQGSWGQAQL